MEFVYDGSLYEAAEHLMDEVCRGVNDLASTIAGLSKPEDLDVNLGEIAEELRSIRHVMAEGLKKVSSTGQDLMKLDEGFNAGYMASKYGRNTSLMENPQEGITYTESNFNNDNKYYFMYYEKAMEKMLESDKYTDEQKEKIREAKEKVHEYYEYYSNLIKLKEQENHLYMLENDKDYANKYIKENFGEEIAALKKSQGSQYMSPEAAIKTREINKIQEAINETKKECGIEIEKNWWEKFTSAVSNIKDSALKTGAAWGKAFNSGNLSDYGDALKQTGCTFVVTASSAASGAAKLGELVIDGLTFVGGSALSGVAWLFDHDTGKDLMDGTLDWIRKDLVGEANKYIYENTSIGKWINENSNLKYDSEGAQMIRKVTEFATKIGVATAATIATGGAAAPAAIGIGALYGTGNEVEKYAQSVDRENGESYDYKRAFLKAFAGAGTGAAEFYGYGQMGAGMLGVNISPKASTSFAKNFLTTGTLADTASVVIDHGVNVALGDENWQDALIYGGGELALALGMSAIGARKATNSARAAEAGSNISKSLDFKMTETYDGLLRRYGSEFEVDRRIQAIVNTGNWNYLKNYDGLVSNLYEYTGGDVNNLESFLISKKLSRYSDCKLIGTTIARVGDYSPKVNMFEELNFYKSLDISTNTKIYFQQKLDYNKDICNALDAFEDLKNKSKNIASKIDNIYVTGIDCPSDPYWAKVHNDPDFVCAALGGGGDIQFFAPTDNELYLSTIYHEAGHCLDEKCVISNSDKWQQACSLDGEWASYYAMDAYNTRPTDRFAEDFADSVANLRMMGPDEFIKKYQNRAQILYDIAPELFN